MRKNTGKRSEEIFDEAMQRFGNAAFVFKFTDAAEARGTNRRPVVIKAQPSDRLVVLRGDTFFAEIKSTTHETRFDFNLLRTTQGAFAKMIEKAGGKYYVFIHSLHLNKWYQIPYSYIRAMKDAGRSSLKFEELPECTLI